MSVIFEQDLIQLAEKFVATFHVQIAPKSEKEVIQMIAHHIDALLYNVTSVACVMALIHGKQKIEPKHLEQVMTYITSQCMPQLASAKMRGGSPTGFPSQYFGVPMAAYTPNDRAGAHVSTETVDFASSTARSGMGPMTGGGRRDRGEIPKVLESNAKAMAFMHKVLDHHNTKIGRKATSILLHIMDIHMYCFAQDIASGQAPVTVSKLSSILKLKRHSVFH